MSIVTLGSIGFFLFVPHVLMVATIPMDFATRKAAASAAGFIDMFAYVGAAITGIGSGWLIDTYGWSAALTFWMASAFVASVCMMTLWRYRPPAEKYA